MINNKAYNKTEAQSLKPKSKAASRLFLKLHTMPRVIASPWRKWLGLGVLIVILIIALFLFFYN